MESLILLAFALLALLVIYLKVKKLITFVRHGAGKSSCDCGMCSSSCLSRERAMSINDINQKQNISN